MPISRTSWLIWRDSDFLFGLGQQGDNFCLLIAMWSQISLFALIIYVVVGRIALVGEKEDSQSFP